MARRSLPAAAPHQGERLKLRRAWKARPGAGGPDDSLTSLQWLQEFSFLPADPEAPSASGHLGPPPGVLLQGSCGPASPPAGDTAAKGVPPSMGKATASGARQPPAGCQRDAQAKPPYSYATLICMALRASPRAQLTLAAIYAWIAQNFSYYRHAQPSWQVSPGGRAGGRRRVLCSRGDGPARLGTGRMGAALPPPKPWRRFLPGWGPRGVGSNSPPH